MCASYPLAPNHSQCWALWPESKADIWIQGAPRVGQEGTGSSQWPSAGVHFCARRVRHREVWQLVRGHQPPAQEEAAYRFTLPPYELASAGWPRWPIGHTSREGEAGTEALSQVKVEKCLQLRKYGPLTSRLWKSERRLSLVTSAAEARGPARKQSRRTPSPGTPYLSGELGHPGGPPHGDRTRAGGSQAEGT